MFTLEKWQEKLCKESYTRNFYDDKDIINDVFKELCKPIEINADGTKNYNYEHDVDYEEDTIMSKLTIKEKEVYKLTMYKDFLKLCFGHEINDKYGKKIIQPVCIIKYEVQDGEETYTINVEDKKVYGKKISYKFELGEDKTLYKDKEYKPLESNEDIYKRIITNLMNIAVTGTLEGEKLFEKNTQ